MTTSLLLSRRKPHRFTIVVQLDLGVEEGDGAGDVISTEGTSRLWVPRGCRLVLRKIETINRRSYASDWTKIHIQSPKTR
uniref:Wsv512 n=1 Tax=White spot syndrome virus TaxID=92652 RepID=A0A2U9GD15_WSSV|nr:wsv512 [Shrimp white spot syndrome virus]